MGRFFTPPPKMRNPLLTNGKGDDIITFVVSRILGCAPRLPLLPTFHQKDSGSVCRCHAPLSRKALARGRQQAAAGLRPAGEAGEKAGSNGTHGIFFFEPVIAIGSIFYTQKARPAVQDEARRRSFIAF